MSAACRARSTGGQTAGEAECCPSLGATCDRRTSGAGGSRDGGRLGGGAARAAAGAAAPPRGAGAVGPPLVCDVGHYAAMLRLRGAARAPRSAPRWRASAAPQPRLPRTTPTNLQTSSVTPAPHRSGAVGQCPSSRAHRCACRFTPWHGAHDTHIQAASRQSEARAAAQVVSSDCPSCAALCLQPGPDHAITM